MTTPGQSDRAGLPGPGNVTEQVLANGMRVLVRDNHASPSVVLDGSLWGGSILDPLDRPGLAAFAIELLDRGTARHSFAELADLTESVGADIGFGATRHGLTFGAKCLSEDLALVLGLLAEMLAAPTFPDDQVDIVRGQLVTSLAQRRTNTRHRAALAFREVAYGREHPYGRGIDGTPEALAATARGDLEGFYRSCVHPAGGVLVVVGAVEPAAALDLVASTLGEWHPAQAPAARAVVPTPAPAEARRDAYVALPGKSQSDIVLGNPAIPRAHPDWLAASLANTVLGVFAMMGRLGKNVRDDRGLAYYAYSALHGGFGPGPWTAAAGVNPANVAEAIDAILDEMRRMCDEPVPADELDDVKAFVTGSLPLSLEANEGVAGALLDIAVHDLGLDYLERFADRVAGVSSGDVLEAARRHLHPLAPVVAVAGPPREQ